MIMADVLKIFLIVVGMLAVTIGYWLAAEALAPRLVGRAAVTLRRRPILAAALGLALAAPFLLAGAGLWSAGGGPAKAVGFVLLAVPIFVALLGSAGLARRIGEGLPAAADGAQPWRRVLRGGIVLALLFLLPFFGWFLVLPLTLVAGVGAAFRGWRELRRGPTGGEAER